MKTSFYMQITANYWAWSPTTGHCQLYQSLKKFGKRFSSIVNHDIRESKSRMRTPSPSGTISSKSFTKKAKSKTKYCIRCESRSTLNSSFCYNNDKQKCTISIDEANNLIWKNEFNLGINSLNILNCETNQLPANSPNEDQLFISRSPFKKNLMFGVLDGHGGNALGNITKNYLPYYLHLAVENKQNIIQTLRNEKKFEVENLLFDEILSVKKRWNKYIYDFALEIVKNDAAFNDTDSIMSYLSKTMNEIISDGLQYEISEDIDIVSALKNAFIKYDSDLTNEVRHLAENGLLNSENVNIAMSGCCAIVAYIFDNELFVANSGDCRAILGSYDNGNWSAVQLSNDHTAASNPSEVSRILSEHPIEEGRTCIQYGRLLGRLAPLRAFGDIQFKLQSEELNKILAGFPKYKPMSSLKTPPYLTAEPEIFHYHLESNDKFIVLASDGLWDMLSNEEVVELVSAYQQGNAISVLKERAHMFGVPNSDEIIENPDAFSDTANENVASFLIRCALGGFNVETLRSMLTMKSPEVRFYRDDISVIVIFLDNDQIEHHSASQTNSNIE